MDRTLEIVEATRDDAPAIADIHLTARRVAMPYLARPHTDDETRVWFAGCVGDQSAAWWVARRDGRVIGYMLIDGEELDHLYVHPDSQGQGVGTALLHKALSLSPRRVLLATSQRNTRARAFYEKHGFRATDFTDGENEEREPDVYYAWEPPR
jgi:ribosomal protein S18 acetylase RimI-like enzyme